jgi:hypothetical protein
MRPCIEQSNDLAPLSPFLYWLGCITNTPDMIFGKDSVSLITELPQGRAEVFCCGSADAIGRQAF